MKRLFILLGLIITPILIISVVNGMSASPSHSLNEEKCTRTCHDKGCVHFVNAQSTSKVSQNLAGMYKMNIQWLRNNPLGLSYKEMNLLVYVILSPLTIILLTWGIIRKKNG